MQYRSKSINVDAFQYKGEPKTELPVWAQNHRALSPMNGMSEIARNLVGTLLVPILGRHVECVPGDWLIYDGSDVSVVRNQDFDTFYEAVPVSPAEIPDTPE